MQFTPLLFDSFRLGSNAGCHTPRPRKTQLKLRCGGTNGWKLSENNLKTSVEQFGKKTPLTVLVDRVTDPVMIAHGTGDVEG